MEIKDSGERREFKTGAVRDIGEGKGRCDLLPLDILAPIMPKQEYANILHQIYSFMQSGDVEFLYLAIASFAIENEWTVSKMILEVSVQYEEGAEKYGEHNWERGIPLHCYLDSAIRHFLKFVDGQQDEPHNRAYIWNLLGAIWTYKNLPDMVDIYFPKKPESTESEDSTEEGLRESLTTSENLSDLASVLSSMDPNTTVGEVLASLN